MKYDYHVFVCCNQKAEGKKCCGEETGLDAVKFLREQVKALQTDKKIRVQRAGCLDVCSKGPALVVYPEGCFYHYHDKEDLRKIAECHLLEGKTAENLIIGDES